MNDMIQTENLSKRFRSTSALNEAILVVPEGAIYALVGANGAGKTTLIKLLMNIFRPTSGRAQVMGIECRRLAGRDFQRIGYVSENQEMPDWMTVEAMLDYLRPFYPQWDRGLEQQLVRQFDLPLNRKLKHLSRGMRMKAAFASSLAYRPNLIVLDEPFSGLDPLVRDEIIEGLLDRAPETTIFLSSHDLAEIESFASHVGYLEQGRILFSEEMSALSDRFREITITLRTPSPVPQNIPSTWLQVSSKTLHRPGDEDDYSAKDVPVTIRWVPQQDPVRGFRWLKSSERHRQDKHPRGPSTPRHQARCHSINL
jgi:ABC-2 type transport system ATP-binding protein